MYYKICVFEGFIPTLHTCGLPKNVYARWKVHGWGVVVKGWGWCRETWDLAAAKTRKDDEIWTESAKKTRSNVRYDSAGVCMASPGDAS